MQTTFFSFKQTSRTNKIEYLYKIVQEWHRKHENYHNNHAENYISSVPDCICSSSAGPDYFTITHVCDFDESNLLG